MANYKPDMEKKLIKEKEKILKDVPEFLYEYIEEYLPLKSNELRTHIAYAKDIINFLTYYSSYIIKDLNLITLDDMNNVTHRILHNYFKHITQYSTTYITAAGKEVTKIRTNSSVTKARKLAALKKFYEYLIKENKVRNNPTIDLEINKTLFSRINNKLDMLDIKDIVKEIDNGNNVSSKREEKSHERLKIRDKTIFLILSYTGIRVSELVSLDIQDVDTKECIIKVTRKNNKIEEIPYPSAISNDIEEYMIYRDKISNKVKEEYKKALFISQKKTRLTTESVRIMLKKYGYRTDIDISGCHMLRRSFLSTLYNNTGDIRLVARVGGHSVATASKYYADVDEERLRNTLSDFDYK